MTKQSSIRMCAASILAGLSLILTGCFITPGKFSSELVLSSDESFSFTYEGEIFFLGLSSLAQMGAAAEEFEPDECYDDETYETRECTEAELARQRADWDAGAEARAEEAKRKAEQMSAMLGGIDPNDPQATEELRQLLLRHEGWDRVEDKGNGGFDVSYSVTGKITHDFLFPVIEGVPGTNPFVQMIIRDGKVVRINAPGFATDSGDNPMTGMMGGLAGLAAMGGGENAAMAENMPDIPQLDGTFSIVTKGDLKIRANNTDEGAQPTPTGEVLRWEISPRTKDAPTALIAFGQ
ncbi:hypothetical protein [Erythrobacter sp. THAF29]|uniref:hypothetical protein n=1 Tax=Erythrobacter sp. THAF29 TaxID=2587851 RepID=UPI0012684CBA|nr:hypothetical protein [Erythrobacter sp. THAF29]QFT77409.1 hypothetical protein FIU90_07635 [Erythrobacter sp. THAF29]